MKILALFAAVVALVLALAVAGPISERLADRNSYQAAAERLDLQRKQFDLAQHQAQASATLPARILADYGLLALLGVGAAGLGYVAFDGYQKRQARVTEDRRLILPDARGVLPVTRAQLEADDLADLVARALEAYHVRQIEEARRPGPVAHALTYAPRYSTGAAPALADEPQRSALLPGMTDFATILQAGFSPSKSAIFLGLGAGGEHITVPLHSLCHIALCGATGGGKSNLLRLIVPQLQAIGARVVLADPHYTPLDHENGDDWRAITSRLYKPPAVKPAEIDELLSWLVEELEHRLERRNAGDPVGAPLFLAFDELPVICDVVKDAPARMGKILREGRKVHLLTVGASQDFLVKTIGGSSAVRDCYRTAAYVGGDKLSAAALLDMPAREIDDGALSTGLALLRSAATSPARQVRVPLASNPAIEVLLDQKRSPIAGSASEVAGSARSGFSEDAEMDENGHGGKSTSAASDTVHTTSGLFDAERYYGVKYLRMKGESKTAIIRALWQAQGGKAYQVAALEYDQILAALAAERR